MVAPPLQIAVRERAECSCIPLREDDRLPGGTDGEIDREVRSNRHSGHSAEWIGSGARARSARTARTARAPHLRRALPPRFHVAVLVAAIATHRVVIVTFLRRDDEAVAADGAALIGTGYARCTTH